MPLNRLLRLGTLCRPYSRVFVFCSRAIGRVPLSLAPTKALKVGASSSPHASSQPLGSTNEGVQEFVAFFVAKGALGGERRSSEEPPRLLNGAGPMLLEGAPPTLEEGGEARREASPAHAGGPSTVGEVRIMEVPPTSSEGAEVADPAPSGDTVSAAHGKVGAPPAVPSKGTAIVAASGGSILSGGGGFLLLPELAEAFQARIPVLQGREGGGTAPLTLVRFGTSRTVGEFGGRCVRADEHGAPIPWQSYTGLPQPFVRDAEAEEELWEAQLDRGRAIVHALNDALNFHQDLGTVQKVTPRFYLPFHVGAS